MNHNRVFYTTSLALCSGSKANDPSDAFSRSAVGPDCLCCHISASGWHCCLDFPGKQRWDLWRVLDRLLQGTKVKKVYLWLLHVRRDEAERKLKKNKEGIAISARNFSGKMVLCRKITISWNWKFLQELQAFRDQFCWEGKGDRWSSGQGDCPASLEHPCGLEGRDCPVTDQMVLQVLQTSVPLTMR